MTVKILHGDCIELMKSLPAESVDCCVTSPPYWGLRDYGVDGQMGLERCLGDHLEVMVNVFREVRRILKTTGTLWLNYGDCYATTPNGKKAADYKADGSDDRAFRDKPFSTVGAIYDPDAPARTIGKTGSKHIKNSSIQKTGRVVSGGYLKPKDLCMMPNRLAIALQEDGWWVRSEIIWAKPNPMPESVRDRPATSHEKIFLLTKSQKYFYNAVDVRQEAAAASIDRWAQDIESQTGSTRANGGRKTNGNMKAVGGRNAAPGQRPNAFTRNENANGFRGGSYTNGAPGPRQNTGNIEGDGTRSLRNYEPAPVQVWEMATQPFKGAHFATFPPELAERCIKAGCPRGGVVFDPFGGAGTTGLVSAELGHDAIMTELNQEYIEMARSRIKTGLHRVICALPEKNKDAGPLFAEVSA